MQALIMFLYNILFVPLAGLRLIYKICKDKSYKKYAAERFGFIKLKSSSIYIHVVSLGEFNAAIPLIKLLQKKYPLQNIFITCTTPTARNAITKVFANTLQVAYLPYDNIFLCRSFIKKLQPKIALIFEKELWPELFKALKKYNTTIFLVNAALTKHSLKNYQKFPKIIKNLLDQVDYIATQTQDDLLNFQKLNINPNKIAVLGNIKFALELPDDMHSRFASFANILNKPNNLVIIAASTHQAEEDLILQTFNILKQQFSNLTLIIAPRHPDRFNKVAKIIENYNLSYAKYSEYPVSKNQEVFLLDTLGELLYFYNLADIAIVCGSFVSHVGCHNILEPAALGLPIVVGNYYQNYTNLIEQFANNNALKIANANNLANILAELIENDCTRKAMANSALQLYQNGSGALTNTLHLLEKYL